MDAVFFCWWLQVIYKCNDGLKCNYSDALWCNEKEIQFTKLIKYRPDVVSTKFFFILENSILWVIWWLSYLCLKTISMNYLWMKLFKNFTIRFLGDLRTVLKLVHFLHLFTLLIWVKNLEESIRLKPNYFKKQQNLVLTFPYLR